MATCKLIAVPVDPSHRTDIGPSKAWCIVHNMDAPDGICDVGKIEFARDEAITAIRAERAKLNPKTT